MSESEQAPRDATREQQTKEAELGRTRRGSPADAQTETRDMSTQESEVARRHREESAKAARAAKPEISK